MQGRVASINPLPPEAWHGEKDGFLFTLRPPSLSLLLSCVQHFMCIAQYFGEIPGGENQPPFMFSSISLLIVIESFFHHRMLLEAKYAQLHDKPTLVKLLLGPRIKRGALGAAKHHFQCCDLPLFFSRFHEQTGWYYSRYNRSFNDVVAG
jgi:hypothetical protein